MADQFFELKFARCNQSNGSGKTTFENNNINLSLINSPNYQFLYRNEPRMVISREAASVIGKFISIGPSPTKTTTPPFCVANKASRVHEGAPEHSSVTLGKSPSNEDRTKSFMFPSDIPRVDKMVLSAPTFSASSSRSLEMSGTRPYLSNNSKKNFGHKTANSEKA